MSYTSASHTVQDVVDYVTRQFGDEAAIQISAPDIIRWTNAAQDEIFRKAEPIKASVTTDLIAGQETYIFPDDVLRIQSIYLNGSPLEYKTTQNAEEYILDADPQRSVTGVPIIWYEWGGSFTLFPKPSAGSVGGIKFNYVKAPTKVDAIGDALSIPDMYYNRLLEYVLQQAYELDENFNAADMKASQFASNMLDMTGKEQMKPSTYPTITVLEEDQY